MVKLAVFVAVTNLVAFQSYVVYSELFEFNKHVRPLLLNQHPIFITHGNLSLPNANFEAFHAEEISSLLVYDFQKIRMDSTTFAYLTGYMRRRQYTLFMWTKYPTFVHIFPNETLTEVYNFQYQFMICSGLRFNTRPKINSVIIALADSIIPQMSNADLLLKMRYKNAVQALVDHYDFALYLQCNNRRLSKAKSYEISSVSVLNLCSGCFTINQSIYFNELPLGKVVTVQG
jgi:hypothetical protein